MLSKISPLRNQQPEKFKTAQKSSDVNFGSISSGTQKISKFYTSNSVKKALLFAEDHNLLFSASFALLLTCVFRPASIMILPSKKNQDDQKYAAAQSIASGVIGFLLSTLIFTPFQNASKSLKDKLNKTPDEIKKLNFLKNDSYLMKNEAYRKTASTYIDRLPDIVFSAPKGILTIALIPPILKYVFGWEKKQKEEKKNDANKIIYNNRVVNMQNQETANKTVSQKLNGGVK